MPTYTDYTPLSTDRCWSCAAELPPGVRYCRDCGRRVHLTTHADLEATTRRLVAPAAARAPRTHLLPAARRGFKIKRSPLAFSLAANLLLLAMLMSPSSPDSAGTDATPDASAPVIARLSVPDASEFLPDTHASSDHAPSEVGTTRSCEYPASAVPPTAVAPKRRPRLAARALNRARPADIRTQYRAAIAEPVSREVALRSLDAELRRARRHLSRVRIDASPPIDATVVEALGELGRQRVRLIHSRSRKSDIPTAACSVAPPPGTTFVEASTE